jgi:hypothetical protein
MNVIIEIHYTGDSKIAQKGSFPLRGKNAVQVALDFWKQIQKEMSYHAELDNVMVNGDEDVTEMVKELEKTEGRKIDQDCRNLPF